MLNINTISSFFLLTNVFHLFFKNNKYYLYSFLFLFLSSIIYHETKDESVKLLDKLFIYNIVFTGGYLLFLHNNFDIPTILAIIFFISNIYLYYFGFFCNKYVFDNDKNIAENFHSLLHLTGSLGHHCIISII